MPLSSGIIEVQTRTGKRRTEARRFWDGWWPWTATVYLAQYRGDDQNRWHGSI